MRHFSEWWRQEGSALLGGVGVWIAEPGSENGRIHVHAAIRGGTFLDYRAIWRSWSAFLNNNGHSNPKGHGWHAGDERGRHKGNTSARILGGYMAKYLTKSFEDGRREQERRYRAVGLDRPTPTRVTGVALGEVAEYLSDTFGSGLSIRFYHDPRDGRLGGCWFDTG